VRVLLQVLAPGVEHSDEADLGAEMTSVGGDGTQRLGCRLEQGGVDRFLVLEGDFGSRCRNVKTTWKYGTGSNSAWRSASHAARAAP
jgi:hypothetical protein